MKKHKKLTMEEIRELSDQVLRRFSRDFNPDPDEDGMAGITIHTKEAQTRVTELAQALRHTPIGGPDWYNVLYLLVLEWGVNLKYLYPVAAKLGPIGIALNKGLIYGIKYLAKRAMVKQIDMGSINEN